MGVNVVTFLGYSYNHGNYIEIRNNLELNEIIWEGKFETVDNHIDFDVLKLEVVKWGIEDNGIVIYVNYRKEK